MRLHWVSISVVAMVSMAGCAPTVWVRPGASPEMASIVEEQCDQRAAALTPGSSIHFGGRHTFGKDLAASALEGVVDGVRQGLAKSRCMNDNGFYAQRAAPDSARQVAVLSAPSPAPVQTDPVNPPSRASTPTAHPATETLIAPVDALQAASYTPPVDRRQVLTQDFMSLPDRSRTKAAFLQGACSAGDMSACILSEAYSPKRISLN